MNTKSHWTTCFDIILNFQLTFKFKLISECKFNINILIEHVTQNFESIYQTSNFDRENKLNWEVGSLIPHHFWSENGHFLNLFYNCIDCFILTHEFYFPIFLYNASISVAFPFSYLTLLSAPNFPFHFDPSFPPVFKKLN